MGIITSLLFSELNLTVAKIYFAVPIRRNLCTWEALLSEIRYSYLQFFSRSEQNYQS